MTDSNKTHLLTIVDRSGSMSYVAADMRGGLDTFFKEQAELDGECLVDYVQFDTEYEKVFEDTPVADAKAILQPRGGTALLDAIGKGVTDLGEKLAKLDESQRPGTVLVVVVTDGHENSSREWDAEAVKELIKRQENEWNWKFTFLGANIDAVAVGAQFGFSVESSLTYSTANIGQTMSSLNTYAGATRSGVKGAYTDEDRRNALEPDNS